MYNPILFLDIDGVLNSEKWYEYIYANNKSSWYNEKCLTKRMIKHSIDDKAIQLINYICDKTNAQVVISSTWRYGRTVEFLQQILDDRGGTFKVIDKTPEYDIRYRGYEIDAWISKNRSKDESGDYFEFTNYAILDDDIGDMLIKQNDNVFEINRWTGITREDVDEIIEFLNKGDNMKRCDLPIKTLRVVNYENKYVIVYDTKMKYNSGKVKERYYKGQEGREVVIFNSLEEALDKISYLQSEDCKEKWVRVK